MTGILRTARIYDAVSEEDGYRILADRLWPRGIRKADAHLDAWLKTTAPDNDLRKQYHKDGDYSAFRQKYFKQLDENEDTPALISVIHEKLKSGNVTLLTASRNINSCNVSALKEYLEKKI